MKKGEKTKRLQEYNADPSHLFAGKKIIPCPSFFQAEINNNIVRCHPDDVPILVQDDVEGK
ncbi:MAG: hypothetical protein FJ045_01085 [Crenarchaeota archaeon]|nr:hypothetical protein [Thermoproteota archaeon]